MSGVAGDAGFIYQRKVVLYRVLASILSRSFQNATIEFEDHSHDTADVYIDLRLREYQESRYRTTFIEIKSSDRLVKKDICKVVEYFLTIDQSKPADNYELVHASQKIDFIKKINKEPSLLNKEFQGTSNDALNSLREKMVTRYYPETGSNFLSHDDLELRSIALIGDILKSAGIEKSHLSAKIYNASRIFLEKCVHDESKRLKESKYSLSAPTSKSSLDLDADKILGCDDGLYSTVASETAEEMHIIKFNLQALYNFPTNTETERVL